MAHLIAHALHDSQLQVRSAFLHSDGLFVTLTPGQPRGALPPVGQPECRLTDQPLRPERLREPRPPIPQVPAATCSFSNG